MGRASDFSILPDERHRNAAIDNAVGLVTCFSSAFGLALISATFWIRDRAFMDKPNSKRHTRSIGNNGNT